MSVCDVCDLPLGNSDGFVLTTTEVVQDKEYWKYAFVHAFTFIKDSNPSDKTMLMMLVQRQATIDTGWHICESCANKFAFNHTVAKTRLAETLADPNKQYGPAQYSGLALIAATKALAELYGSESNARTPSAATQPENKPLVASETDAAPVKLQRRRLSPRSLAVFAIIVCALAVGGAFAFVRKGIQENAAANRAAGYEVAWEVRTKDPISCIALSPDGKLAAVSTYYDAKIFDIATGRMTAKHVLQRGYRENEPSTIFTIAFSPDSSQLALGYESGKIRILDAKTGDILRGRLKDTKSSSIAVDCIVFTDGGKRLLVDLGTSIEVLNADSFAMLEDLDIYADKSVSFPLCPDGRSVVFLSPGKETFYIFDTVTMSRIPLKFVSPKDYCLVHFGTDMKTVRMIEGKTAKAMIVADYPSGQIRKRIELPGDNGSYDRAVPCVGTEICVVFGENDPVVVDTAAGTASRLVPRLPSIRPEPTRDAVVNRDGNLLTQSGSKKAVFWRKL